MVHPYIRSTVRLIFDKLKKQHLKTKATYSTGRPEIPNPTPHSADPLLRLHGTGRDGTTLSAPCSQSPSAARGHGSARACAHANPTRPAGSGAPTQSQRNPPPHPLTRPPAATRSCPCPPPSSPLRLRSARGNLTTPRRIACEPQPSPARPQPN